PETRHRARSARSVRTWRALLIPQAGEINIALEQYHPDWNRQRPVRVMKLLEKANMERVRSS
ncbi:MAG: hypothetical protein ACREFT_03295, partial [Acetobacteraceae bacterium]